MSATSDLFDRSGPRWFTIPSGRCFLNDLARGICESLGDRLSTAQILTPTRRGARAMARSFSQQARDGALLLPQIRAIGDLDEGEPPFDLEALALDLPPALSPLRRRFELARLITTEYDGLDGREVSAKLALELADSLAGFFDSLALEEIDAADRLESLVTGYGEDQYTLETWAQHWQVSAKFLNVAVQAWPKRLAELGLMDPSQRQVTLIRRLVDQWTDHPPQTPLILAGTTGSAPSMADLMQVVANAPLGAVVLPGLDLSLADDVWAQIEESHPQGTMKRALDRHGVTREQVRTWPAAMEADRKGDARRRLLNEALRPAEATKDWLAQIAVLKAEEGDTLNEGLKGLTEIHTARDEEAASVIALLMRETLETPGQVAALITPDLSLSRRVAARLSRWGLQPDSSAGEPLANSQTGRFLLDVLALMETPHDPVRLLSLFNHPRCRFADHFGRYGLEKGALRGATPVSIDSITHILVTPNHEGRVNEAAIDLWEQYLALMEPAQGYVFDDLNRSVGRIVALAESLAVEDGQILWSGAPGLQASEMLAELMRESAGFTISGLREVSDILTHQIARCKVRTGGNTHPRLLILGAIEARLVKADRLILAGLEEGVWPQAPELDPFLSRPMRQKLGLPTPERRTGLSAHDFVQAAAAPEVFLVTRHRREGEPQVASRWLWRLQTLCDGAGLKIPTDGRYLDWARAMDAGLAEKPATLKPAVRPAPKPPIEVRPKSMPVTQVEVFVRDPYAIYARRILDLKPMDRPNEPVEARQRGTAIHQSLERFAEAGVLGEEGVRRLTDMLEEELTETHLSPAQMALQRPLLAGMAREFVAFETERRKDRPRLVIEQQGELKLGTSRGAFSLTAKADRIEVRETGVDILDFKTGQPPSAKAVAAGFYPQLTLTAAILRHGGFAGIEAEKPVGELLYVQVTPDKTATRNAVQKGEIATDLAEKALAGLRQRLEAYADPDKPYLSWTAPQFQKVRGGDYDHLARLYEWSVLGDEETSEEEVSE
ncbi:MAG: double-strand break repair protein AddB [Asticcacaulis sp.]|uniref:double-strand break repair protein AddB n=1 Tax=Asticcacaulis sp. TaxID=1872648 RepID=UPI0039E46D28